VEAKDRGWFPFRLHVGYGWACVGRPAKTGPTIPRRAIGKIIEVDDMVRSRGDRNENG